MFQVLVNNQVFLLNRTCQENWSLEESFRIHNINGYQILWIIQKHLLLCRELGVQYPLNKLKLQGFKSPNFGFKDTSSLAVTSKYKMWSLHQKDFLEETYKLYPEERDQVTEILKKAVIDDMLILSFLYDWRSRQDPQ